MPKKKEFWDTKNPKKTSAKLTPAQMSAAKTRAKKAGRSYPNLVDNAWASKQK
jgi:catalase (peroxidase I)